VSRWLSSCRSRASPRVGERLIIVVGDEDDRREYVVGA
jgi:hypothetical protein